MTNIARFRFRDYLKTVGLRGPWRITLRDQLAVSDPAGGNRQPDDETPDLKCHWTRTLASRGISAQCIWETSINPSSPIIAFLISLLLALPDAVIRKASTKRM
jgi:hypothetical protein